MKKLKGLEIISNSTLLNGKDNFTGVEKLVVENWFSDGTYSERYKCEIASHSGTDAVVILLAYRSQSGDIFVVTRKQARPIAYLRDGIIAFEDLPAGCFEAGRSIEDLAVKEIAEEVGIWVDPCRVKKLGNPVYSSVGWTNEKVYFVLVFLTKEEAEKIVANPVVKNSSGEVMESGAEVGLIKLSIAMENTKAMAAEVAFDRLLEYLNKND